MFQQMKIKTLLSWGFGVLIALTSIMAAIVLQRADVINGHVVDIVADATPKAVAATDIRLNVLRNWANTLLLLRCLGKWRNQAHNRRNDRQ